MKRTIKAFLIGLIPIMLCYCEIVYAQAFLNDKVTVKSQKTFANRKVNYHYQVINNSSKKIVWFAIGYDYYHGIAELKVPPVGWTFESGIPQNSTKSPGNWNVNLVTTEESKYIYLEWQNKGSSDILPGQVVSGFSVTVPQADDCYLTAHWTVFFADSDIASRRLVVDDTVQNKPMRKNNRL